MMDGDFLLTDEAREILDGYEEKLALLIDNQYDHFSDAEVTIAWRRFKRLEVEFMRHREWIQKEMKRRELM